MADGFSTSALTLANQVSVLAARHWLGISYAQNPSGTVAGLLADVLPDVISRRRMDRFFDGIADTVAGIISEPGLRFRSLPVNEAEAAVLAVAEVFERAPSYDPEILTTSLDRLERPLRAYGATRVRAWSLNGQASAYFDILLRECCQYTKEIRQALPSFTADALTEILQRTSMIDEQLAAALNRIPR